MRLIGSPPSPATQTPSFRKFARPAHILHIVHFRVNPFCSLEKRPHIHPLSAVARRQQPKLSLTATGLRLRPPSGASGSGVLAHVMFDHENAGLPPSPPPPCGTSGTGIRQADSQRNPCARLDASNLQTKNSLSLCRCNGFIPGRLAEEISWGSRRGAAYEIKIRTRLLSGRLWRGLSGAAVSRGLGFLPLAYPTFLVNLAGAPNGERFGGHVFGNG